MPADIWKKFMAAVTKGQTLGTFPTVTKFPGKVLGTSRSTYRFSPATSAPASTTVTSGKAPVRGAPGSSSTTSTTARPPSEGESSATTSGAVVPGG